MSPSSRFLLGLKWGYTSVLQLDWADSAIPTRPPHSTLSELADFSWGKILNNPLGLVMDGATHTPTPKQGLKALGRGEF